MQNKLNGPVAVFSTGDRVTDQMIREMGVAAEGAGCRSSAPEVVWFTRADLAQTALPWARRVAAAAGQETILVLHQGQGLRAGERYAILEFLCTRKHNSEFGNCSGTQELGIWRERSRAEALRQEGWSKLNEKYYCVDEYLRLSESGS